MKTNFFIILTFILIFACNSKEKNKKMVQSYYINTKWIGKWERSEWQNEATLKIKKIEKDSIEFSIFASSGGNTGEIEGKAFVKNNVASFHSRINKENCRILFNLFGDTLIKVTQKIGNCFSGMGVFYSGKYRNSKIIKPNKTNKNLMDLGVLENKNEENKFKLLVGTNYSLFVNSTQLTAEEENIDQFKAKVFSSGIKGLYTIMENIIMIDSVNNIWAAVINDNKVYYFTNCDEYKNTLPKTIDNWRQRFKEYEVVYNK